MSTPPPPGPGPQDPQGPYPQGQYAQGPGAAPGPYPYRPWGQGYRPYNTPAPVNGVAIAALVVFGIGWGFFDCNNMPILCQIARPELRDTGYGIMNLASISCGGFGGSTMVSRPDRGGT